MQEKNDLTKRGFLKLGGLGAMALMGLSNPPTAFSDTEKKSKSYNNRIDVHTHFHPLEFFKEIEKRLGKSEEALGWNLLTMKRDTFMQTYSIEERLDWMSQFGIDKSVFSFPTISMFMDEIAAPKKRNEMSQFMNDFFCENTSEISKQGIVLCRCSPRDGSGF